MNLVSAKNPAEGAWKLARFRPGTSTRAFTLLEMVLVVGSLSALAGVGCIAFSDIETGASSAKIQSDVSSLNEAVTLYIASGGELIGSSDWFNDRPSPGGGDADGEGGVDDPTAHFME